MRTKTTSTANNNTKTKKVAATKPEPAWDAPLSTWPTDKFERLAKVTWGDNPQSIKYRMAMEIVRLRKGKR